MSPCGRIKSSLTQVGAGGPAAPGAPTGAGTGWAMLVGASSAPSVRLDPAPALEQGPLAGGSGGQLCRPLAPAPPGTAAQRVGVPRSAPPRCQDPAFSCPCPAQGGCTVRGCGTERRAGSPRTSPAASPTAWPWRAMCAEWSVCGWRPTCSCLAGPSPASVRGGLVLEPGPPGPPQGPH